MGQGSWVSKLKDAGKLPAARQAQMDDAWEAYLRPLLGAATSAGLGPDNPAGLAVVFDRSINQGPGAARSALSRMTGGTVGDARALEYGRVASGLAPRTASTIIARVARVVSKMQAVV
jgi:hypothetical protein